MYLPCLNEHRHAVGLWLASALLTLTACGGMTEGSHDPDNASPSEARTVDGSLTAMAGRGAHAWAVGAGGKVLRYQSGSWHRVSFPHELDLRQVSVSPSGNVAVLAESEDTSRLFLRSETGWLEVALPDALPDQPLIDLALDERDHLWAVSTVPNDRVPRAGAFYTESYVELDQLLFERDASGRWIQHDRKGVLAVNAQSSILIRDDSGTWRLDGTDWQPLQLEVPCESGWPWVMRKSKIHGSSGGTWCQGDLKGSIESHSDLPTKAGLFNAPWISPGGSIFVGSTRGQIARFEGGAWKALPGSLEGRVLAVWGTSDSDVWAVGEFGLAHWDGSRLEVDDSL